MLPFLALLSGLTVLLYFVKQVNNLRLRLKLKTTDWPAAVARDFLLAAANNIPLFTPVGFLASSEEGQIVEDDIRVLAKLAEEIQLNDGKVI